MGMAERMPEGGFGVPGRAALLRLAAALLGVAFAIALYPLWLRPAPPGQLPGLATSQNFDARAPFRSVTGLLLLPLALPWLLRPSLRRLAAADSRQWAQNGALLSALLALWLALQLLPLPWVLLPPLAVWTACALLRRFPARFSRRDLLLLPALGTVTIALLDLGVPYDRALLLGGLTIGALRLLVALPGRTELLPADSFALAPLGLVLQSTLLPTAARHAAAPPLLLALGTPLLLRFALLRWPRLRPRFRAALVWGIYPAACVAYASAYSVIGVEGRPRISVFEESEHLVPAAEMVRGERPYRDIIPPHGFLQDAFLDYLLLRGGAGSVGDVMRARDAIETLGGAVQYALATVATGSPEVGLAASFLSQLLGTSGATVRFLPSLASLACLVWGVRRRRPGACGLAGALAGVAALTSLDYGAFTLATLGVALVRNRRRAYVWAAFRGVALVALPAALAFAAYGLLGDLLRVSLVEIPGWAPVYALHPFSVPLPFHIWHSFPEVLIALCDHTTLVYLAGVAIVAALGAALLVRPSRRSEPALLIAVWCAANFWTYAARQHTNFRFALAPLLAVVVWRSFRSRSPALRLAAPALVALLVVVGQPFSHLTVLAIQREARGPLEPGATGWKAVPGVPRARGALFETRDAALVETVARYAADHLAPGDTYFDFMNRGLLYYLLDRDCPLRQIEVAFYEPEAAQRGVIARIAANPRIRFALVPAADDPCNGVDCVPNAVRAPLVWRYVQESFVPEVRTGVVEIWRRK